MSIDQTKRYFEFHGEDPKRGTKSSSKFWEVWVEGTILHTRFGRIGATGQSVDKQFSSKKAAVEALSKAIKAKTSKGYSELPFTDGGGSDGSNDIQTPLSSTHPDVLSANREFEQWWEIYQPIAVTDFFLSDIPTGLDAKCIWSEVATENGDFIFDDFYPGGGSSSIELHSTICHWITKTPRKKSGAKAGLPIPVAVRQFCYEYSGEESCRQCPLDDFCYGEGDQFAAVSTLRRPQLCSSIQELGHAVGIELTGNENKGDQKNGESEDMQFPSDYDGLLKVVLSKSLTNQQVIDLLKEHAHRPSQCEACSELSDPRTEIDGKNGLFPIVFSTYREQLDSEVLTYMATVVDIIAEEDYSWNLAEWSAHPHSTVEMLESGAEEWGRFLYGNGSLMEMYEQQYSGEELETQLALVAKHPLATREILEAWVRESHENMWNEPYGKVPECIGADSDFDECDYCKSLLDKHLQLIDAQPATQKKQKDEVAPQGESLGNARPNGSKCMSCSEQLAKGANFCPSCGTKTSPGPKFCANCGSERSGDGKFCAQCGVSFN